MFLKSVHNTILLPLQKIKEQDISLSFHIKTYLKSNKCEIQIICIYDITSSAFIKKEKGCEFYPN